MQQMAGADGSLFTEPGAGENLARKQESGEEGHRQTLPLIKGCLW